AIAQRLGMPEGILEEARGGIDPDRLAVEALNSDRHREGEAAQSASAEQRSAARDAERARERVTKELQSLEANRARLIDKTQRDMEAELAQMRSRLRDATRELQKAERLNVFERAQAVEAAKEDVAEAETSVKEVAKGKQRRRRAPLPAIAAGDQVFLVDVPTPGEAMSPPDQRVDGASRAGVRELRIIHGKGTGTLRRAVRDMLSKHALVQGHAGAPPRGGGEGVTVVELAG